MPRRVSMPGADELFRTTGGAILHPAARAQAAAALPAEERLRAVPSLPAEDAAATTGESAAARRSPKRRRGEPGERRSSGRERHEEKITVYVSAEELIELEQARLTLRGDHGLAVDRGRIVREAVAIVLADLETRGESSVLVERLRET